MPREPDGERDAAAREGVHLVGELRPDHRNAGERGVENVFAQRRVSLEDEAEDRD